MLAASQSETINSVVSRRGLVARVAAINQPGEAIKVAWRRSVSRASGAGPVMVGEAAHGRRGLEQRLYW